MKKAIMALAAVFAAGAFAAKPAYSVDNQTIDIVMSIQSLAVTTVKVYDAVSAVVGASKVITGRAVFSNAGNGNQDFSIRIASTTGAGGWTQETGTGVVPQDKYRLRTIWAIYNATTTTASFDDDDILTTSNQMSDSTKFFSNTGTVGNVGTPALYGGYNIPIFGLGDNERHLFFRFDAGALGTSGTATAWVNVTATATP